MKKALQARNMNIRAAMVANRGLHNPKFGSFSFFEEVTSQELQLNRGQFFFGHFTDAVGDVIVLDQAPAPGKLMVELLVFDPAKGYYNFYELIGNNSGADWFYRGDSADVLTDNTFLYRDPPPGVPRFGSKLRCSGCHVSGGPIMKELAAPHNDWWTRARPLMFGDHTLSSEVQAMVDAVMDAEEFSNGVDVGIRNLEASAGYKVVKGKLSLQERLRPLFCETEINLESDRETLEGGSTDVLIPSRFFVSALLGLPSFSIPKSKYEALLKSRKMQFPETNRRDADHAWLTPVKGHSDITAVTGLLDANTIDSKFIGDVLSVDAENPTLSKTRCDLLKLVPKVDADWKLSLMKNLEESSLAGAKQLLANMRSAKTYKEYELDAKEQAALISRMLDSSVGLESAFTKLVELRRSVFKSEISQNPRGQILEPGFRVIFPIPGVN
jgi:hypothetical protein